MADSMIFHRLSDNANDIGREVVRKAVKAILAETDADVITIKRADRDRIAMIECYVGGGEFYLVVTPDNKISMHLVTEIPGSPLHTRMLSPLLSGMLRTARRFVLLFVVLWLRIGLFAISIPA